MIQTAKNENGLIVAIECLECNGKGQVSILDCGMPSSACCGGCYKDFQCLICRGDGELDLDLTDEHITDSVAMLKSIDYRITGFRELLSWYRKEPNADLDDLNQQITRLKLREEKILMDLWQYVHHSRSVDIEFNEGWEV